MLLHLLLVSFPDIDLKFQYILQKILFQKLFGFPSVSAFAWRFSGGARPDDAVRKDFRFQISDDAVTGVRPGTRYGSYGYALRATAVGIPTKFLTTCSDVIPCLCDERRKQARHLAGVGRAHGASIECGGLRKSIRTRFC